MTTRVLVTGAGGFIGHHLVNLVAETAGKRPIERHDLSKPHGVRGRTSDNTKLRQALGRDPQISLREGLEPTYHWIELELGKAGLFRSSLDRQELDQLTRSWNRVFS